MDADHLDIYGDAKAIQDTFREFADKVEDKTKYLFLKDCHLEGLTIAVNEQATFKAFNIRIENSNYVFDVETPSETIKNIQRSDYLEDTI
jgi:UDP-N-acetylmuramate--alanine ligase